MADDVARNFCFSADPEDFQTYSFTSRMQCDRTTRSGDAIVFGILLRYPSELICQTLICQIQFFAETKRRFNNANHVNMTTTDARTIQLELCRLDTNSALSDINPIDSDVIILGISIFF